VAEDGEVLLRGPWLMRGYHRQPEATRAALDADGWLRTGDVGRIDADGHLSISDRKKDLIKTAGGKYVAPQELEATLKALCPQISQVLVHGDRRPYVTALVTLDPGMLDCWAAVQNLSGLNPEELARHAQVEAMIQAAVDRMNRQLPRFATVKRFAVLPAEFSEAAGEVTPSQKLKRKIIEARHEGVLEGLYVERQRVPA